MHVSSLSAARRLSVAALVLTLGAGLAACSSNSTSASASSTSSTGSAMNMAAASASASATGMSGMPMGMSSADPMPTGNGLAASQDGYTLKLVSTSLDTTAFRFEIVDAAGMAVTAFQPDQTKLMHFYLIRSDLSGFQHVHPTMAADGVWTAPVKSAAPGVYRVFASFIVKDSAGTLKAFVLSHAVNVAGSVTAVAVPAPAASTTVDGYTLTVSGEAMAGMEHTLKVSVSKNGQPVTDLQPYLETYAHLTAIHQDDLAFAHLHPAGAEATTDTGGPDLTFDTTLPESGIWRFFIQFQTGGVLHTAAITLNAR